MKRFLALLLTVSCLAVLCGCTEKTITEEAPAEPLAETGVVSALSYSNGTIVSRFSCSDGVWSWVDDPTFPLDPTAINTLLTELDPVLQLTGAGRAEDLSGYGLDRENKFLSITCDDVVTTMYFGSRNDHDQYYMRYADDESLVYLVDSSFFDLLSCNIFDMAVLPTLPALNADTIKSVSYTCPDGVRAYLLLSNGEWMAGGRKISWRVSSLAEELSKLQASACVDYTPSAAALTLCGLNASSDVSIGYINSVGTDTFFSIKIGAMAEDGSGYYVNLGESSTIYLVESQALTVLMSLDAWAHAQVATDTDANSADK